MPVPAVRPTPGRRRYRYEPSTSNVITKSPLLRDPYEHRYVYVRDSGLPLAGEGLYAKTKIKEESVLVKSVQLTESGHNSFFLNIPIRFKSVRGIPTHFRGNQLEQVIKYRSKSSV